MADHDQPPTIRPRRTWSQLWPALPAELQINIWRYAVSTSQVHRIKCTWKNEDTVDDDDRGDITPAEDLRESTQTARAVATISTQARQIALECLPHIIHLTRGGLFRFNRDRDIICLVDFSRKEVHVDRLMDVISETASVRHIGLECETPIRNLPAAWVQATAGGQLAEWGQDIWIMKPWLKYHSIKTLSVVYTGTEQQPFLLGDRRVLFAKKLEAQALLGDRNASETGDGYDSERDLGGSGRLTRTRYLRLEHELSGSPEVGITLTTIGPNGCYIKRKAKAVWRLVEESELQHVSHAYLWQHLLCLAGHWRRKNQGHRA